MFDFKKTVCLLLSVATVISLSACGKDSGETDSKTSSAGSSVTASQSSKAEDKVVGEYYSTDVWEHVPLVTKQALDMGFKGGEGCQWMTFITFDEIDGSTAYAGVDVGGMMKSTDGGKTWNQSTVGFKPYGATGIAVDPKNIDRVIAIGCNSRQSDENGLYLSTNQGETWVGKCCQPVKANRDNRRQVAFDASSYDKSANACKTIYWVTENFKNDQQMGIYKSTDAGATWKKIDGSEKYANTCISVCPTNGNVYLTTSNGLLRSTDGGASFSATSLKADCTYLCTVTTEPNKIYVTAADGFYVYEISSDKTTKLCATGVNNYPRYATFISVSPSNTKKMVLQSDALSFAGNYSNINFYSEDGGKSWAQSKSDYSGSFIPYNNRQNPSSFHPKKENVVIKLGGDFIMRSEDGGKNWKLSNDGNNAMCIGGKFNFNVNDPNLISVSSQDYNGGFSTDGGKTWTYLNWSGAGWGGMTYGAYMINKTTAVAGVTGSWYNGSVEIAVTFDGGKTFNRTGIMTNGATVGISALGNNDIVCFADHRSTDGGKTWTKMNGCTGVYTIDYKKGTMYGVNDYFVVKSEDNGVTWTPLGTTGNKASDMAYNYETNTLYVTSQNALYALDAATQRLLPVKYGSYNAASVCIDPQNCNIMYVACKDYFNASSMSVMRSTDAGKTWTCLNRLANDGRTGPDGARASDFVRVAGDGSVWCVAACRGIWKMARPDLSKK